jgi:hypothetical protein
MLLIVDPEVHKFAKVPFAQSPTTLQPDSYLPSDDSLPPDAVLEGCTQLLVLTDDVCLIGRCAKATTTSQPVLPEQRLYTSRALMCAYACNQPHTIVIQREDGEGERFTVSPIVDFELLKHLVQVVHDPETLADVVWQTALLVGNDWPGKAGPVLENLIVTGRLANDKNLDRVTLLLQPLERRLPVSAFSGDLQPKKIGYRTMSSYYDSVLRDDAALMPFFGAAIAAKSLFSVAASSSMT